MPRTIVDNNRHAVGQLQDCQVIAFIGGGQMATALIAGLLHSGWDAGRIIVVEPYEEQRQKLASSLGVRTLPSADATLDEVDVVVWAVKPQTLVAAVASVVPLLGSPLHVSIVAGIDTRTLACQLNSDRIVRVMPNTPALVGSGVTGMLAMAGVAVLDRQLAENLMAATGYTFWVDSDERIDAVTAASGSGPGYVFYFLECYQSAVEALGFSKEQARELVLRTAAGAVKQAGSDYTPFSVLRERVTSKGGTTAAGLQVLNEHQLPVAVTGAVQSAYSRAQALSRELGQSPV